MQRHDAIIVGGGPAGSTCAWKLREAGLDVLVIDKAAFPRSKVCAGWVTPVILEELQIDPAEYGQGRVLQPMTSFRVGRIGGGSMVVDCGRPVSFGIRRVEFDHYLLHRSGAQVQAPETVKSVRREGRAWIVNERFTAPMLVAAGGHFCPIARLLGTANSSADGERIAGGPVVAAEEIEFELPPEQRAACPIVPDVPEIYFCDDLLGYGWCIRKGNFLNIGLGREDSRNVRSHVTAFCDWLRAEGRISGEFPDKFHGHAYVVYNHSGRPLVDEGVLWIGDAAGLAYSESGEGIRPGVESGIMAARVIVAAAGDYGRTALAPYQAMIEARFGPRHTFWPAEHRTRPLRRWLAHRLLANRWFVRRVLLDRWFLHARQAAIR
jgi:menaquinone-9 beta-reductase